MERKNKKKIVVTADDFGYCHCRNVGIAECFVASKGVVSNVSVMVTRPMVVFEEKHVSLGLHLNLTEGKPVCGDLKTMVDEEGQLLGKFGFRAALKDLDEREVRREIEAQLERFKERYGRLPSHVDGHQHVHILDKVRTVFARSLHSYGVTKTRLPLQHVSHYEHIPAQLTTFFESVSKEAEECKKVFDKHNIYYCSHFIGFSTQGGMLTEERVFEALSLVKDGETVEWMTHPGKACSCGHGDDFARSLDRELEMSLLSSHRFRQRLEEMDFKICSFDEI